MIILIGGEGCTGKTKLAYDLMLEHQIPYFSVDILMMGIYRSNPSCGYTPMDSVFNISKFVWPILKEMIKTNIENNTNYIYEGFQIRPENINEFDLQYRKNIIPIYIGFSKEYIDNNYHIINETRSIIESREDIDSMDKMIKRNHRIRSECEKEKIEFNCIEADYLEEMKQIKVKINQMLKKYS